MSGEQAFGCGLVGGEGGNIAADQAGLDSLDFFLPHATPMTSAMAICGSWRMAAAIWAEERIIGTWSVVTVPPRRSASMRQMSGESVIGLLGAPTICATLDFGQS